MKTKLKTIRFEKMVPIDPNQSIKIVQIEQTFEFNCGLIKEDSLPEIPKISPEIITHKFIGFNNEVEKAKKHLILDDEKEL